MREERRRRIRSRSREELAQTLATAHEELGSAQARESVISRRLLSAATPEAGVDPPEVRGLTNELGDAHREIVLLQGRIVRIEGELAEVAQHDAAPSPRDA